MLIKAGLLEVGQKPLVVQRLDHRAGVKLARLVHGGGVAAFDESEVDGEDVIVDFDGWDFSRIS